MEFEIDVSGEDIFTKNFTVCIADKNNIIKGYKMAPDIINILNSRYGQGFYKYKKSGKGISSFKVRTYCIIIFHLFKSIPLKSGINLVICRDFDGKENDIKSNLVFLLGNLLNIKIEGLRFCRLREESNAHRYAYLMRKDDKNMMKTYIKIPLEEFEKFLKKWKVPMDTTESAATLVCPPGLVTRRTPQLLVQAVLTLKIYKFYVFRLAKVHITP